MMRRNGLREAIVQHFDFLAPLVSLRMTGVLWRALVWGFWLFYFGFIVLILALRYSILPHIEDYRADIEHLMSQGLGQSVSIGRIEASWEGINPDLSLLDVRIADAEGRPALALNRVEAILSWWSVPSAKLKLRLLRIDEPALNIRRDSEGRLFIAGIPLGQEQGDADVSGWILAQRRIRIRGATIVWEDELRKAPPLILEDLNFALDNDGNRHRFGLTALPPEGLASKIDVRGDFHGADLEQMVLWSGQTYAEIEYADLAVWRTWVDYPVALPHGRGGIRSWLSFAEGRLSEVTADVSLQDVSLRFAPNLPSLALDSMSGRIRARLSDNGFSASGSRVELVTHALATRKSGATEFHPAIRVEPMDFSVDWKFPSDSDKGAGSANANQFDIGVLARLAEYLPFDANTRQLLSDYAPRGRVSGLVAKWSGDAESLQSYSLKAGFDELALKPQGYFPGFSGLSGGLEFNERGGVATLRSKKSSVELPRVFPEPTIQFDKLSAQAQWKVGRSGLEAELSRVEFAGPDAVGSAQGTYRNSGEGPGVVDLTATLTHGEARAVWRYMPHEVNADARHWLRDSLLSGHASEAHLILKGDLTHFPFLDEAQGQFLVTVKARDVALDYGKGWPRIADIHGDLRFEGNGMVVDAHQGSILGASLAGTRAEIPDFDAPVSTLLVKGKAQGPTSEFLKFIEESPVAERIDHFTEDMRARGNGQLDLELKIPLEEKRLADSVIKGNYTFVDNEVTVDAALPPLTQVNGSLYFSGSDLQIPEINASLFGGPLKIKGGAQKDGRVLISANGSINISQARKQSDIPLLANFSGSSPYRGEIRINKRNADLVIDTALVGLASTLPEPFAKKATDSMPLRFEKKLLVAPASKQSRSGKSGNSQETPLRDQISASLGNVLSLQVIRRKQKEGFVAERGAIAIGRSLQLPDAGVTLGLTAKQLDIDRWRRALASGGEGAPAAGTSTSMPLDTVHINTADLVLFGRHFNDVDLTLSPKLPQWKIRLNSRQASGDLLWDSAGSGKVTARLRHVSMDSSPPSMEDPSMGESMERMPALDVVANEFSVGKRRFGRVELQASNDGGTWQLHRIQANNSDGRLSGSGQWHLAGGQSLTRLDFRIESSDVGKLLERLGYPGTVRGGIAQLEGKIGWNGRPSDLDYGTLQGEMRLEASKGQFVKLDPGAAGKLLGLISLQGLPRRITLDFKDVFSEGFAFDSVASALTVQNGIMRTDRLQIDGPSARVLMRGEVDLQHETQQLDVNIQPELGGTAALGIALVNPVAGVATWVAHKVLQNPLNQMFGFNYRVTGKWDDSKVEKVVGSAPAVSVPRLPTILNQTGAENESSSQ